MEAVFFLMKKIQNFRLFLVHVAKKIRNAEAGNFKAEIFTHDKIDKLFEYENLG